MIEKKDYKIKFIKEYLEDELYQFEVECKGCFFGVIIECENLSYRLDFYGTTRFKQDMDDELNETNFVYDYNIVFLKKVTLKNITNAVDKLWLSNAFEKMIPS